MGGIKALTVANQQQMQRDVPRAEQNPMDAAVAGIARLTLASAKEEQPAAALRAQKIELLMEEMIAPREVAALVADYAVTTCDAQFATIRDIPLLANKQKDDNHLWSVDGGLRPECSQFITRLQEVIDENGGAFSLTVENLLKPIPILGQPKSFTQVFIEPLSRLGQILKNLKFSTLIISSQGVENYGTDNAASRICCFLNSMQTNNEVFANLLHVSLPSYVLHDPEQSMQRIPHCVRDAKRLTSVKVECAFIEDPKPYTREWSWSKAKFKLPLFEVPLTKVELTNCPLDKKAIEAWAKENIPCQGQGFAIEQGRPNANSSHDYLITIPPPPSH